MSSNTLRGNHHHLLQCMFYLGKFSTRRLLFGSFWVVSKIHVSSPGMILKENFTYSLFPSSGTLAGRRGEMQTSLVGQVCCLCCIYFMHLQDLPDAIHPTFSWSSSCHPSRVFCVEGHAWCFAWHHSDQVPKPFNFLLCYAVLYWLNFN